MKGYYTKEDILKMLKFQHPNETEVKLTEKMIEIHRALNTVDVSWRRSNKKFYANIISYEQYFERQMQDDY